MAEAVGKYLASELNLPLNFQSAGVATVDGLPMSTNAIKALAGKGISHDIHVSQVVSEDLLNWADFVFTMTENHKKIIIDMYTEHKNKIYNFSTYLYNRVEDVIDPYGGSYDTYLACLETLEMMVTHMIEKLK